MDLADIRKEIDGIDLQMRDLLMRRMDCSREVAQAKLEAGSTDVYRADRERQILETLGADVPKDRRAQYLSVVRKVMETSRMYQYGLIFDANPSLFERIEGSGLASAPSVLVCVRLTRPNKPNALSTVLSMIGDYGFDMEQVELADAGKDLRKATFDLVIRGDISQNRMRCLLFQLSKESEDFQILGTS